LTFTADKLTLHGLYMRNIYKMEDHTVFYSMVISQRVHRVTKGLN